uniref:ABC transporter permease n=1 Tax=Streptomyces sp. NBC_00008 TaxID=2903610 RepID=A0AAU2VUS8_9ACTN
MTFSTTTDDDARRTGTSSPAAGRAARGRPAVLVLAWTECGLLLRHPAFLAAVALYVAFWIYDLVPGDAAHAYPVLQDESWSVHLPLLLLAAGVLLAANQGALRSHRNLTEPMYDVLVVGRPRRVCAHLLSLLPAALFALLLTAGRIGYLAARAGAVGETRPWDLMAGPVCVLLAGVVGVMLSTLATSAAVAPMALVGLGMLTFAGAVNTSATWRWFGLLAFENENAAPLPAALVHRPSLAHLAWLAALVVLLGAAAVLRAGGRGTVLRVTTALALVAALVAGFTQTRGLSAADKDQVSAYTDHPAAHQRCTTEKGLTICAFPEFAPWTSQWAKVARGVLAYAPGEVAGAPYTIRQRIFPPGGASSNGQPPPLTAWADDDARAGTPKAVTVGTDWSDGAAGGDRRSDAVVEFSTGFAYRTVTGDVPRQPRLTMVCGARATLVLWLAGRATPGSQEALRSTRDRTFGGGISLPLLNSGAGISFEPRAADFAFDLIDHPSQDNATVIKKNWAELTAPDTTVDRAAHLLGVKAPPAIPASGQVAGC